MYKLQNFIFILLLTALFSCEDIIEIDLNSADPQIVIDAAVTDQPGPYTVKISKTGDYFKPSVFPVVSGAVVQTADDAGFSEMLQESEPGIYQTESLQGTPGRAYTLTVIAEGEEYTAVSCMPEAVQIDSLRYNYQPGGGFGPEGEKGYRLHIHFTDRAGTGDYYRLKIYQNDKLVLGYFLYNDKFTDGNSFDYNDFEDYLFDLNDTLRVELLTIDKSAYDYYETLKNIIAAGGDDMPMTQAAPANPNTNLSNGALGYFGAYTVRTDSIIIR